MDSRWKTSLCKICGKQFEHRLNFNRQFCSQDCWLRQHKKRERLIRCVCAHCNKEFYRHKSEILHKTFCSQQCAKRGQKDTSIELLIEEWLQSCKVSYEKQYQVRFEGYYHTIADFFIAPNILIYCDGDYYHRLPGRKNRDRRITAELVKRGYIIYRLSEKSILQGERPLIAVS